MLRILVEQDHGVPTGEALEADVATAHNEAVVGMERDATDPAPVREHGGGFSALGQAVDTAAMHVAEHQSPPGNPYGAFDEAVAVGQSFHPSPLRVEVFEVA